MDSHRRNRSNNFNNNNNNTTHQPENQRRGALLEGDPRNARQQEQRHGVGSELSGQSAAFEYSFPINDDEEEDDETSELENDGNSDTSPDDEHGADDDNGDEHAQHFRQHSKTEDTSEVISNNSTPYYTPMDFLHTSFEFPSPKLVERLSDDKAGSDSPTSPVTVASQRVTPLPPTESQHLPTITKVVPSASTNKFLQLNTPSSSSSGRKLRRFSLYERRSCSPQRLLIKSAAISVDGSGCTQTDASYANAQHHQRPLFVDDKENTKPKYGERIEEVPVMGVGHGSGNSPIIIDEPTTANSPRILSAANETSRLAYSPKLLATINNLNLTGSPLGVISSAGYKNGNYFKFPEIDHVVHGPESILDGSGCGSGGVSTTGQQQLDCDSQPTARNNRAKGIVSKLSALAISGSTSPPQSCGTLVKGRGKTQHNTPTTGSSTPSSGDLNTPTTATEMAISLANVCSSRIDERKNRKNKNNLTIRITAEVPNASDTPFTTSASPKPKTPTIKNTKEKALSLDSAATSEASAAAALATNRAAGLAVVVPGCQVGAVSGPSGRHSGHGHMESHTSWNELQNAACYRTPLIGSMTSASQLRFRSANVSQERLMPASAALRSTSLSQLSSFSSADMHSKSLNNLQRSNSRRRGGGIGAAVGPPSSSASSGKKSATSEGDSVVGERRFFVEFDETSALREDDDEEVSPRGGISTREGVESEEYLLTSKHTLVTPHRTGAHKLGTPLLHTSNTNLKTLPEFLTLVEFNSPNAVGSGSGVTGTGDTAYAFKQKSMDLPNSSLATIAAGGAMVHPSPISRMKTATTTTGASATSTTNLLQRRGSNHSLTLNLHGSCSNLLGSSRCGLSVSNYSLGSSTNINSKSSCHLDLNTAITPQSGLHLGIHLPGASLSVAGASTQGTKQSLFRRRGSNHSLTLSTNLAAISCGNLLNSFASQNSLNAAHGGLAAIGSCSVTRTTSFITPTSNTASNTMTPKRGLLERRGSNQSLTLNMGSSFGGIGCGGTVGAGGAGNFGGVGHSTLTTSNLYLMGDSTSSCLEENTSTSGAAKSNALLAGCCAHQTHYRKFFSSENLNRANTQFADLNQAHKRNSKQLCFGSVADLKPSSDAGDNMAGIDACVVEGSAGGARKELFDFQESTMCTCTGVRNVMTTRPLSPQTTSEEFKIYLANIQMLQNASNALNQIDLIKLNHIFDNSYAAISSKSKDSQALPMLNVPSGAGGNDNYSAGADGHSSTGGGNRETSEDCEVATRYLNAIRSMLSSIQLDEDEQKRMFRDLHKEFWDLPLNHQEKPMVFGSQAKNRYKTILPNENSRVLLEHENQQLAEFCVDQEEKEHEQEECTGNDGTRGFICEEIAAATSAELNNTNEEGPPYINANYIKGPDYTSKCYVATQGPLPNTIFEFWLMIYQNTWRHLRKSASESRHGSPELKCNPDHNRNAADVDPGRESSSFAMQQYYPKIVMLTNFLESNRQKCSVYFPMELHEVFLSAAKGAIMTPTEALFDLLDPYLQTAKTPSVKTSKREGIPQANIDCFRLEPSAEVCQAAGLPPTHTNFFALKNVGIVRKNGYSIRKLILLYCIQLNLTDTDVSNPVSTASQPRRLLLIQRLYCYHYWYPDWPDHRSPRDINTLVDICLHILNLGKCETEFELHDDSEPATPTPTRDMTTGRHSSHIDSSQHVHLYQQDIFNVVQPLPVIHCSAGIGRTGCLTAILNGVRQLRQSLAYSLTSMAAAASKKSAGPDAKLVLSPVDFCLPKHFMEYQPAAHVKQAADVILSPLLPELLSDTDSSYTRNTLLYIKYILERNSCPVDSVGAHNTKDIACTADEDMRTSPNAEGAAASGMILSLENLPRLPDIFVDILGIVCNLRLQRGGMVQNSEQYELIHRTICLYLKRTFALKRF